MRYIEFHLLHFLSIPNILFITKLEDFTHILITTVIQHKIFVRWHLLSTLTAPTHMLLNEHFFYCSKSNPDAFYLHERQVKLCTVVILEISYIVGLLSTPYELL